MIISVDNPSVQRVIAVLRREVPKPAELPRPTTPYNDDCVGVLRWMGMDPDEFGPRELCPMGLHPEAVTDTPCMWTEWPMPDLAHGDPEDYNTMGYVPGWVIDDVDRFARWWDAQRDPEAAVNAVWG